MPERLDTMPFRCLLMVPDVHAESPFVDEARRCGMYHDTVHQDRVVFFQVTSVESHAFGPFPAVSHQEMAGTWPRNLFPDCQGRNAVSVYSFLLSSTHN